MALAVIVVPPTLLSPDDPRYGRLVRNLTIRRGLEGPQLILTWEAPTESLLMDTIRVVRRLYEFPKNPNDGKVVYEGPTGAGFITDCYDRIQTTAGETMAPSNIEACRCYYYTIFTRSESVYGEFQYETGPYGGNDYWLYSVETQVAELAIQTGFFAEALFNLLPNVYILGDKLLESPDKGGDVYALYRAFDSGNPLVEAPPQYFNLYENVDPTKEPKKKGPLARFLRSIAIEPDIVKGLIDCMPNLWDVNETCCSNLPALGELIGVDVNREFTCTRQREEIKNYVAIYKIKGTKGGVEAEARLISEIAATAKEWCGNILISNRADRTSLKYPNPGLSQTFQLDSDDTDFTPWVKVSGSGKAYGFGRFTVYFLLECDDCLSDQIVYKLNRVLPRNWPVCRQGEMVYVDCKWVDTYDRTRLKEMFEEIIEDAVKTEDYRPVFWMTSNRLTDSPDGVLPPPVDPDLHRPFYRQQTNSLKSLTAHPYRVCLEQFFDQEEATSRNTEDYTDCILISNTTSRTSNSLRWKTLGCTRCLPVEDASDKTEFAGDIEAVTSSAVHLLLRSNTLTALANTLQSLVGPCAVGADFSYDEVILEEEMLKNGTYVGDGENDRIIPTGFTDGSLRSISIYRLGTTDQAVHKTDTMPGKAVKSDSGQSFDGLALVGLNFAVDGLPMLNEDGAVYHWSVLVTGASSGGGGGNTEYTGGFTQIWVTEGYTDQTRGFLANFDIMPSGFVLNQTGSAGAGFNIVASSITSASAITNDNPGMFSTPPAFFTDPEGYRQVSLPVASGTAGQEANLSWSWNGIPFSTKVISQSAG
jgi:hypothetical protein